MPRPIRIVYTGESREAVNESQALERSLQGVQNQATQTKAALNSVWGDTNQIRSFTKALDGVNGLIKWPAIFAGASMAAQGIGALGAGLVALTAAVAPAAGALGALPALASAFAQALGTMRLATAGLADAITADDAGLAQALTGLSESATTTVLALRDLRPEFEGLRRIAQEGVFGPLTDEIGPLADTYLPRLQKIVGDTAAALGGIGEKLAQSLRSKEWTAAIDELGAANVRVIENLGNAFVSALPGIRDLTLAFQPLVTWLSEGAARFGEWLSRVVEANRANGDLARSVGTVRETLSTLGSIIRNVAEGFWEIGKAAAPLGREILADLEKVTAAFATWARSMEGQQTLRAYFESAQPAIYEVARLVRDVAAAFLRVSQDEGFADLVRMLRVDLLPVLEQVVRATSAAFGPALIGLLREVGQLFLSVAGASGPLVAFVDGLTNIAEALGWVIKSVPGVRELVVALAGVAGVMKAIQFATIITGARGLATSIGLVGPAAGTAAGQVAAASGAMSRSLAGVTASAATTRLAMGGIGTGIVGATPVVLGNAGRMTTAMTGLRGAVARVGTAFGPWGIAIGTAVAVAMPYLDDLYRKLSDITDKLPGANSVSNLIDKISASPGTSPQEAQYPGYYSVPESKKVTQGAANAPDNRKPYSTPSPAAAKSPDSRGGTMGVGRAAGVVSGDTEGLSPGLMAALQGMSAETGRAIYVQSGFRTAAEQGALVAQKGIYDAQTNPTGAAPVGSSNHETGDAADITPGREAFGGVAGKYGATFPLPKEPFHVQLAGVTSASVVPVSAYSPGATTTGGGGFAAGPTAPPSPPPPTKQQLAYQKVIGAVMETAQSLEQDIPEVAKRIAPALQKLYEDLGDERLSEKALASLKAQGAKLREALANLVDADALRDKLPAIRAAIGMIADDDTRNRLRKQADELAAITRKLFKDGLISDGELATLDEKTKRLNKIVMDALKVDIREQAGALRKDLDQLFRDGFITDEQLNTAEQALAKIPAMIKRFWKDGVLSPAERKALAAQLDIAGDIVAAGRDAEAAAERAFGRLKAVFRQVFADGVISDADLRQLGESAAKIGGVIGEGMQAAVQAVEDARAGFDRAWGEFRSAVESAFREQVIGKFQLTLDFAAVEEQTRLMEMALADASARWTAVLAQGMDDGAATVRAAVERVLAANAEYTAALISQDRERITQAIAEKLAANAALAALDAAGLGERAQAVLAAGQALIAAEQAIGAQQVSEQKRIWEETKTAALAGVLALVDEVGSQLRSGEITWAEAVQRIGVALTEAGMDANTAADLLGQNVAGTMGAAAVAIQASVDKLTAAVNRLVVALGGQLEEVRTITREMLALALEADNAAAKAAGAAEKAAPPGGPLPMYATGGVAGYPQIARVAERFPEAIIPLPPQMPEWLRARLVELAQGGWRNPEGVLSRWAPRKRPGEGLRLMVPASGGSPLTGVVGGELRPLPGLPVEPPAAAGGVTVYNIEVVVPVETGVLVRESDVGAEIARVAAPAIRDELAKLERGTGYGPLVRPPGNTTLPPQI